MNGEEVSTNANFSFPVSGNANYVAHFVQVYHVNAICTPEGSGNLFGMGTYVVKNGGKAYMLLCDDTDRDYGDLKVAEKFRGECEALGFETISMKEDFATIYGEDVYKVEEEALSPAA